MQRHLTNIVCLRRQLLSCGRRRCASASAATIPAIPATARPHLHSWLHAESSASIATTPHCNNSKLPPVPGSRQLSQPTPSHAAPNWLLLRMALRGHPPLTRSTSALSAAMAPSCTPGALVVMPTWARCELLQRRSSSTASGADSFRALGVSPELQERLASRDILRPLPVQAAVLPAVLGGRNAAIKSCTGSGKTLAYLLPVLQLALQRRRAAEAAAAAAAAAAATAVPTVDSPDRARSGSSSGGGSAAALKQQARSLQALIVAPSRELCIQIQRTAQELLPAGASDRRLVQQLIGGANPKRQAAALAGGEGGVWPLVVVGTPGRVAELVTNGTLHVWNCPLLVLDEVDQLRAHEDFRQHVDNICTHVGRKLGPGLAGSSSSSSSGNSSHTASSTSSTNNSSNSPGAAAADVQITRSSNLTTGNAASSDASGTRSSMIGSGGSGGGGRQTVIVSASLDGRELSRYAAWCPNPLPVVLSSNQALPQPPQERSQPHAGSQQRPTGQSGKGVAGQFDEQAAKNNSHAPSRADRTGGRTSCVGAPDPQNTPVVEDPRDAEAAAAAAAAAAGPLSGVLPPHLKHIYVLCPGEHRTEHVRRLIHALGAERALLFVPKQSHAMVTKYKLEARHMEVTILHGQLSKLARGNILNAFRAGTFRALIVTDLGARGLDLPDCDAIINFGPPPDPLSYAHRAGRTGRAGAPGVVASVVTRQELQQLRGTVKKLGATLQAVSILNGKIVPGEEIGGHREEDVGTASRPHRAHR
ncbi:hypothetical protein Agub_g5269 [Astrephomene gubernaculifera]|uniref:Uncharacterized protein n=1 Tax=Astrephomene gubernaculifera TaxID=47775 RepID=A0AAD3HKG3_9CHLO|nr:hypothetical protein Agub_g5269 [Astrephomene gubernaculifera]